MPILRARGQQAGSNSGGVEKKNYYSKAKNKEVKFSPSAKTEDGCGTLKRKVCNALDKRKIKKRRVMKRGVVASSRNRHSSRSSSSAGAAAGTTAVNTSDSALSKLLGDLTQAVRFLQKKMGMGGAIAKDVRSNQAPPYPSLQHQRKWKGRPKSNIYKVDAARRAIWIRDVVLAVRYGKRVPGYAQWRKPTLYPCRTAQDRRRYAGLVAMEGKKFAA